MDTATASCLCGEVSITATLPSKWVAHCHCTQCQRGAGAGFVTWAGFASSGCQVNDPQHRLRWFVSSPGAERGFCGRCGSSLLFRSQRWPDELHITRANFSGPLDRAPQAHVFYDTHVDWIALADDLPRKGDPSA